MDIQSMIGLAAIAGGCTWALSRALARVEVATAAHVAKDDEKHAAQDAKILKLERRRK